MTERALTVLQMLPALESGGVERGTLEVARALVQRGHRSVVMSGGGRMVAALEAEGSEHLEWPVGAKSARTLGLVRPLRRLLEERRVDVVHARSRVPAWVGYLALQRMPAAVRPAWVTTVHGPYSKPLYSRVMVSGEVVIAVSNTIRQYIFERYPRVPPERIRVIHRGVDRVEFPWGYRPSEAWLKEWRGRHPRLEDRFVIALPARVTRWKGQEDFVRILGLLRRRGLPVHGLVIGGTDPRKQAFLDELHRRANDAGIERALTFLGHRSDVRDVMSVSDVVLSLSREPEAFGRTTIEALSLGRPAAGYDHGGVGEQLAAVMPEGRVPVGDVEAMANLLERWIRDGAPPVPREHPFTLERMLDATLDVYRDVTRG